MLFNHFFTESSQRLVSRTVRRGVQGAVRCRQATMAAICLILLNKGWGKKLLPWLGDDSSKGSKKPWGLPPRRPQPQNQSKLLVTLLMLLTVLSSWLMSGVFVLPENQQAMVSRLGEFHHMAEPGVN